MICGTMFDDVQTAERADACNHGEFGLFLLNSVLVGRDRSKRFYPEVRCVAEPEPKRILAQIPNPGTLVRDSTLEDEVL